jgi:hypothetical protein
VFAGLALAGIVYGLLGLLLASVPVVYRTATVE